MKLTKLLLKTMPVIVLSTGLVSGITSCSNGGMPKVLTHQTKNVFVYTLHQTSDGRYYYAVSSYGQVTVHEFNYLPMAYIDVDDYVNNLMCFADIYGDEYINYSSHTENGKTTITNSGTNTTAVIDYEKQTITFSDYDKFGCNEKAYAENPLAEGAGGGESYYYKENNQFLFNSLYVSGGTYTIDLSKYSIKPFYDNNHGYLPSDLFRNIFNRSTSTHLFYNGVAFYEVCQSNSINAVDLYADVKAQATNINKDFMEYCYNLLALTFDHKFGLDARYSRAPATRGQIKKFFPNGAYEALAPYKEALTSLDADVSNDALFQVFRDLADDGGHAGYGGVNLLSTGPHESERGPEKTQTFDAQDMIEEARSYAYLKYNDPVGPSDFWGRSDRDNYLKIYDDDATNPILYVTFDSFQHVEGYTTIEEIEAGKVRYEDVTYPTGTYTYGNSYLDTIRMTMGADKYLKAYNSEHTDVPIKNIVLDLSNNGGGTVYTEHFIASWLCGGVTEKIWNPHTKAYAEYTIKADVNGDGKFTSDDYLDDKINVFCITSDTSFSCGNMLPCNLVDNRSTDNTFYIGSPSGGGACFVDSAMHIGLGNVFRSSSTFHMLRGASSKDGNKVSVESGHLDENNKDLWFYQIASTWADCYKFTDRATINKMIRERK